MGMGARSTGAVLCVVGNGDAGDAGDAGASLLGGALAGTLTGDDTA